MRFGILYALIVFCFVSAITPGPNNLMLLTSGVNFGFRRTIPHMLGVGLGFALMVGLVGIGLDAIFTRFPALLPIMRYAGVAYMLWLAAKLALAGPVGEKEYSGNPLGFFGAAAFQWINPKAWFIAVGALTAYAVSEDYTRSVIVVALVFGIVTLPCVAAWVLFGTAMRRVLSNPRFVRPFNIAMALLLVASIIPVLTEG
ncbi:MAG TPA: LysE family translocator [Roseiarcus sp.]|jgi:threonine/homoserine/homoserine lactone efflux protein